MINCNIFRVPRELTDTVMCTAIHHGNYTEWTFLWERYQQSNVETEKETILQALSCSSNTSLLYRFIFEYLQRRKLII